MKIEYIGYIFAFLTVALVAFQLKDAAVLSGVFTFFFLIAKFL